MMKFPLLSTALTLILSLAQADIQPGKPTLNNNNYYWTNALVQQMPLPSHTITKWPWGTVPHKCVRNTIDNNQTPCDPANFEVYDITYADCPIPWNVCRCTDVPSSYNITYIARQMGQLPVKARQWLSEMAFYQGQNGGWGAWADSLEGYINVMTAFPNDTVLFHESGHVIDWWVAGKGLNGWGSDGGQLVNGKSFKDAIMADTCMPTDYAQASWAECFAEMAIQASYELNIGTIPIPHTCISNGLAIVKAVAGSALKYNVTAKCDNRIIASTPVCMNANARASGLCNSVPDYSQPLDKRMREEAILPVVEGITFHRSREAVFEKRSDETIVTAAEKRSVVKFEA